MIKATLEDDKKKLYNNSQFMTVNKMFKEVQMSLNQVKQMVTELSEIDNIRI